MGPTPDDLFATPDQHFLAIDGNDALFLRMDRDAYHRSIFLDRRIAAIEGEPTRVPLAPLIEAARARTPARTGWIFHVAHCGSTLLSRLIDQPQSGLVLREPPPLRQLGIAAASGRAGPEWEGRLRLAAAMAARRYDPSRPTVVKANVPVNFILPQLLALDPGAPAILLHFALEPYLLAILGSASHRAWVDRITDQLHPALAKRVSLPPKAVTAERAAALWLAQMKQFAAALATFPATKSLDAEALFAAPAEVATATAEHLGMGPVDVEAATDLASTYSKDPARHFGESDRRERQEQRRSALRGEIAVARRWIDLSNAVAELPTSLDRPLLGKSSRLLI